MELVESQDEWGLVGRKASPLPFPIVSREQRPSLRHRHQKNGARGGKGQALKTAALQPHIDDV